ncbi:hypothetical protein [Actinomadura hibisca]|uniref:hypothetical protein n=1 Tax=Actinomadura hibisca TaxID=68565 RepID=UPI00082C1D83|nr:hypothetical protein [Actinomadura hibisca]
MAATARPVPRWAEWAAHAVPLVVLPSGLWRFALGLGVPLGFAEGSDLADFPHPVVTPYVFGLSLVAEFFAFLTLGLVRGWGEVFPRWMPLIGGRDVPALAATGVASLGAVAVSLIFGALGLGWRDAMAAPDSPHGFGALVMSAAYLPLLAWGPLLAAVTVHYYLRRRGHSISDNRAGSNTSGNGVSTTTASPDLALRRTR